MKRSLALVGWLASTLATAVVATGCGGGGGGGLDGSAVAQAAQATQGARTARMSMSATVAGQTMRGGGYVDLKGHAADISMSIPQGTIREVFNGKRLYMQLPQSLRKGPLARKPWAMVDIDAVAKAKGIDLGALQTQSDPSQTLDQLRAAGHVHKVGTENVRGTRTTHFSAVVDLRKAAAAKPAAQRAAAERSAEVLIQQLGRSTFPIDVWLDGQKRVRRERFSMPIQGQQLAMTIELYDFGNSHRVTAPPAGQTVDLTQQAAAAQQP